MRTLSTTIAALQRLIAGLQKHQPNATIMIDGTVYTTPQLVQILEALVADVAAAITAKAIFLESARTAAANLEGRRPLVRDLKRNVQIMYGDTESTLADFGLGPRRPGLKTPEIHLAAAAKARATRAARHTMGKRQKAKITGATPTPSAEVERE